MTVFIPRPNGQSHSIIESWPSVCRPKVEHVAHREREIVPDGGASERKGALSLKCLESVWNTKYVIISRGAESA